MKRRIVTLTVIVVLLAATSVWLLMAKRPSVRMPTYGGKTAREWLLDYESKGDRPAEQAFYEMGTNAVPMLIEALEKRDSTWGRFYQKLYGKLPDWAAGRLPMPVYANHQSEAILYLIRHCLAKDRVPPDFIRILADKNDPNRRNVLACIADYLRSRDSNYVPVLVRGLHDADVGFRSDVVMALGTIGPGAKAAVPALFDMINDRSKRNSLGARLLAADSVWKITHQTNGLAEIIREGLASSDSYDALSACISAKHYLTNDPALVPLITRLTAGTPEFLQRMSVSSIGAFGPSAREAIPVMRALTNSTDETIRVEALISLASIDPGRSAEYRKQYDELNSRTNAQVESGVKWDKN